MWNLGNKQRELLRQSLAFFILPFNFHHKLITSFLICYKSIRVALFVIYFPHTCRNFLKTYNFCGCDSKFWLFTYVCSHVYYMSGDAWKEGGIDGTGKHHLKLSMCLYFCLSRCYGIESENFSFWLTFNLSWIQYYWKIRSERLQSAYSYVFNLLKLWLCQIVVMQSCVVVYFIFSLLACDSQRLNQIDVEENEWVESWELGLLSEVWEPFLTSWKIDMNSEGRQLSWMHSLRSCHPSKLGACFTHVL